MLAQLIYLHIEKSAGTSQRALFWEHYGQDKVFWHGYDSPMRKPKEAINVQHRPVIGGHLNYSDFDPSVRKLLFTAVVRDPVARAVSLFYYYSVNETPKNRRIWQLKGLDPSSMLRTVKVCSPFREEISNKQCLRLGGKRSFDAVKGAISKWNFVVGHFDDVDRFNRRLAELLGWGNYSLVRLNTAGTPDYQQSILSEPGLQSALRQLNEEDLKLYEFVRAHDVISHIPDEKIFREYLRPDSRPGDDDIVNRDTVTALRIEPMEIGPFTLKNAPIQVPLRVYNGGRQPLPKNGPRPILIGCHWLGKDGRKLIHESTRTELPKSVFPGETCEVRAKVCRPRDLSPGKYSLQFCLLQLRTRWLETMDDRHTCTLDVDVQ